MALVAPLLVLILVAASQLGMMLNRSQELKTAARDAARLASEDVTITKSAIEARASNAAGGDSLTISITPDTDAPCSGRAGLPVTVSVHDVQPLDVLFVGTASIDIDGSAQFLCATTP